MNGIRLTALGDNEEQARWPALQPCFPRYEPFWIQHVYPLRGTDGRIRADVDERLELMAQENYKCFLSLSVAQHGLDDDAHPERTFSCLQNAGNPEVAEGFNLGSALFHTPNHAPESCG